MRYIFSAISMSAEPKIPKNEVSQCAQKHRNGVADDVCCEVSIFVICSVALMLSLSSIVCSMRQSCAYSLTPQTISHRHSYLLMSVCIRRRQVTLADASVQFSVFAGTFYVFFFYELKRQRKPFVGNTGDRCLCLLGVIETPCIMST